MKPEVNLKLTRVKLEEDVKRMEADQSGKKKMKRPAKRPIELEKWQIDVGSNCPKDCWCRRIVTVSWKGHHKRCFIQQGYITKEQAELIVRIHNEWLFPND